MSAPSPSFTFGDQSKDAAAVAGSTAAAPQAQASAPPLLTGEDYARHKMDPSNVILRAFSEEEENALAKLRANARKDLDDFCGRVEAEDPSFLRIQWEAAVIKCFSVNQALRNFFTLMNAVLDSGLSKKDLEDRILHQWGRAFAKAHFMPRPKLPTKLPNGTDIGCPFLCLGDPQQLNSIIKNAEGASNSVFNAVLKDRKSPSTYDNLLFLGGDSGSGKTHAALFLASYLRKYTADLRSHPPVVVYAASQDLTYQQGYEQMKQYDAPVRTDDRSEAEKRAARDERNAFAVTLLDAVIRTAIEECVGKWLDYFAPDKLPTCFLVLDELTALPALIPALTSRETLRESHKLVLLTLSRGLRELFADVQVVGASTASTASALIACTSFYMIRTYQLLPCSVLFEKRMTELKPLYECLRLNAPYIYVMHNCRCATEALKIIQGEEKNFYKVLSDALGALQPWRALYKTLCKWCNMGSTSPNPTQISSAKKKLAALCDNLEGVLGKINADGTSRINNVEEEEQITCTTVPKGTLQLGEERKNSCRANPQKTLAMFKELSSNFRQGLALLNPEATTSNKKIRKSKKADKSKDTVTGNKRSNSDKAGTAKNTINNNSCTKRSNGTSATSISDNNSLFDKGALKTWLDSQCSLGQSVDRVKEAVFSHAADIASDVIKLYRNSDDLTQYDSTEIHRIVEHGAVLCLNGHQTWQKGIGSSNNNTGAKATSNETASEHKKANTDSGLPDPVHAGLVSVDSTTEQDMLDNYVTVTTTYRMGIHQLILGMTATAGSNAASEGNRVTTPPTMRELCSFHPRALQLFWLHLFAFLSEALRRHAGGDVPTRVFTTVVGQFVCFQDQAPPLTKAQQEVLALMDAGMTDATTLLRAPEAFPGKRNTENAVCDRAQKSNGSGITKKFCKGVDRDPAKRKGLSLILNGDSAAYADTAVIGRGAFALVSVKRRVDYGRSRKELLHDVATLGFRVPELEKEPQKGDYEPQIAATAQLKAHLQCPVAVPVFVLFHRPHYNILRNMPEVEVRAAEDDGTQALRMKPIVLYIRPYLEYTEKTHKSV